MTEAEFDTVDVGSTVYILGAGERYVEATVCAIYRDKYKDGARLKICKKIADDVSIKEGFYKRVEMRLAPIQPEQIPIKKWAWKCKETGEYVLGNGKAAKYFDEYIEDLRRAAFEGSMLHGKHYERIQMSKAGTPLVGCNV